MTSKQIYFLWMHSKIDDARVNPELHEFEELAGKKLPASTVKAAESNVYEESYRPARTAFQAVKFVSASGEKFIVQILGCGFVFRPAIWASRSVRKTPAVRRL